MESKIQFEDFLKKNFLESDTIQADDEEIGFSEVVVTSSLDIAGSKNRLVGLEKILEMHLPDHDDDFDHDYVNAVKWSKAANNNREVVLAKSKKHNDYSVILECKKAFADSKFGDSVVHEFESFCGSVKELSMKKLCPVKTVLSILFVSSFVAFVFALSPINIDGSVGGSKVGFLEAFGKAKKSEAKEEVRMIRVTRDMMSDYIREGKGDEVKEVLEGRVAGVNEEVKRSAADIIKKYIIEQKNNFEKKLK